MKKLLLISLILAVFYPVFWLGYQLILRIDESVVFINDSNKRLIVSIRQGIAVQHNEVPPLGKFKFRPRGDSHFAVYASSLVDHISTCAIDYPYYDYNDDYDYLDDPCCLENSGSCKYITKLNSYFAKKIVYKLDREELVVLSESSE